MIGNIIEEITYIGSIFKMCIYILVLLHYLIIIDLRMHDRLMIGTLNTSLDNYLIHIKYLLIMTNVQGFSLNVYSGNVI